MMPHLSIEELIVEYPIRKGILRRQSGAVRAVNGASFAIAHGETFGLVGESGCGKSSLARAILRLQSPPGGRVLFDAGGRGTPVDLAKLPEASLRALRREMQIVFQDPYSALNPRLSIGTSLTETLRANERLPAAERRRRVAEVLEAVSLPAEVMKLFPHEFSGGQRQRIAIARALITRPRFVVLDEPVSALDVSVRAQILNLLLDMQAERHLTYLFISHDLSVVRYVADQVGVMYLGRIVELGPTEQVFGTPLHPYSALLLSAVPVPRPGAHNLRPRLNGDPPSPLELPAGCAFQTRCPLATELCRTERPKLQPFAGSRSVACHYAGSALIAAGAESHFAQHPTS